LRARSIPEAELAIAWFNEAQGRWVPLPTDLDPATQTVSTQIDHFSAFTLSDGSSTPSTGRSSRCATAAQTS
jgi:hypothetical protein